MLEHIAALIVLLPLAAAALGLLGQRWLGDLGVMRLCTFSVILCAVMAVYLFSLFYANDVTAFEVVLYSWFQTSGFGVDFGVLADKVSIAIMMVIAVVSACVHVYSFGYMTHDKARGRFFAYLSLFTFTMLALVSAPNLLQMFFGWEGVGLASYLLIGFWFQRPAANAAAMKAFIVNRIADVGLLLGLVTTFALIGTLDFANLFASLPQLEEQSFVFLGVEMPVLTLLAVFFLIGAMGKSAQFGFHTWLPDAMEGPTPVSALIHAATMVTAGVFLLARLSPLYELAEGVLYMLAWVGAITAIFAATIGLVQTDIKRVIAYSTCSQLGYMFFACGISAYPAAMFHLVTHAFFKALLFLGAGSVIHAMHDEQDMLKMGGLRKVIPITYGFMWLGSLALMGIPPFAGYFSKDLILEAAFMSEGNLAISLYVLGTLAAFMTAFYSMRVLYLTFHNKPRCSKAVLDKAHESPFIMLAPMALLAVGAVLSGFMFKSMGTLEWWQGAITIAPQHTALEEAHHIPKFYKYLPLGIVLLAIGFASWMYLGSLKRAQLAAQFLELLHRWAKNRWYIDELYQFMVVNPVTRLARWARVWGDEKGIDRFGPNGAAWLTRFVGGQAQHTQSGYIYHYAFLMISALSGLLAWMMLGGK